MRIPEPPRSLAADAQATPCVLGLVAELPSVPWLIVLLAATLAHTPSKSASAPAFFRLTYSFNVLRCSSISFR